MAKIMVAEFNHLIPGMIKKCLQPIGHEVYTASHGEAAIEVWKQSQPDLLMTGIMLPGIDGYELIRQWKSEGSSPKPAIIIAGKGGQPVDTQLASQIGVDAVLNYPFKSTDVVEIVDRVLEEAATGSLTPNPSITPRPAAVSRPAGERVPTGPHPGAPPKAPAPATPARSLKEELVGEGLLDVRGTRPTPFPMGGRPAPVTPRPAAAAPLRGGRAAPAASAILKSVPASVPASRVGDPSAQLRDMLNAKFQEVTDAIIRSLPAIVEKIVDEKLGKR
ncbi:MAG: response regulator [Nitrospirae bacterium]|nr:response regulator [Nitrospirota bacterium]